MRDLPPVGFLVLVLLRSFHPFVKPSLPIFAIFVRLTCLELCPAKWTSPPFQELDFALHRLQLRAFRPRLVKSPLFAYGQIGDFVPALRLRFRAKTKTATGTQSRDY